jgi:arylsulfatase A-like enzyme
VHTVDIHDDVYSGDPYFMRPLPSYRDLRSLSPESDWERRKHDMALHYVDKALGVFLSSLPSDVRERTVVAITSDHGAPSYLGQHALSSSCGSGSFHDEYLHIPFIVNGPGVPASRHGSLASTLDVAPTLCGALEVEPHAAFRGQSLLAQNNGAHYTISEHTHRGPCDPLQGPIYLCLRSSDRKYIFKERLSEHDNSMQETEILFDMTKDPLESINIVKKPEETETVNGFRRLAAERIASIKEQALALRDADRANPQPRN